MNYGLYLSAAGVLSNMHRQDVAANNLANVNTDGFKRSLATLQQRAPEAIEEQMGFEYRHELLDGLGGGVLAAPTQIDVSQASIKPTGRDLDLAMRGSGFFAVQSNGAERLTRDGRFTVAPNQQIVSVNGGHPLLSINGLPIQVDPAAGALKVDEAGRVHQGADVVAEIKLVGADAADLKALGGGLFEATGATRPAAGQVEQGHLEMSNVESISELMKLIAATKAVQANGNLIRYHDTIMDRAANVLGRVA